MKIRLEGMRLVSAANSREHWRKKHKRNTAQLELLHYQHFAALKSVTLPCVVKMTRIGVRLLDNDNLLIAFKHIRDYVATQLLPEATQANQHARRGDDSDPRIKWEYYQAQGPYAVEIEIASER